jgi:hypothetical protein
MRARIAFSDVAALAMQANARIARKILRIE